MRTLLAFTAAALPLVAQVNAAVLAPPAVATGESQLSAEIRQRIANLPYYGVFDNLEYAVIQGPLGATVALAGQVTRPTLKSDAETVVRHIEGVQQVEDHIQVLPLSAADDGIRMAEYRAIYGYPELQHYALANVAPIRIIVANGRVVLKGGVASQGDKDLAGSRARTVAGVAGVKNELKVE